MMRRPHCSSRFRRARHAGLHAALLALAVASCGAGTEREPNVVLIVVDTLRADRLGCYGAERDVTPNIDRLAAEGVRFDRAYTPTPWTMPSVASIFSGLYPAAHGVTGPQTALPEDVETLAEHLRTAGYATAGATSNMLLKDKYGFDQGFDTYLSSEARGHEHISTPGITEQAEGLLDELAAGEAPFFLHLLYFDPHYEYLPHEDIDFAAGDAGRLDGGQSILELRELSSNFSDAELRFVRDVYDEEVHYTDAGIGRVLDKLDALGIADDTIVVLVGDHGEDLMDHGWLGHVKHFHEELVRVPLIVRAPAAARGSVIESRVGILSITPTLLELLRLPAGARPFQAPSLVPQLAGNEPTGTPEILFHVDFAPLRAGNEDKEAHKSGMLVGDHKLTRDDVTGALELYDLSVDPFERDDLASQQLELAEALEARMTRAFEAASAGAGAVELVQHNDEEMALLENLGYGGQ